MTTPKTTPSADPSLAEMVERQSRQIETLLGALERQSRIIESLAGSGARVVTVEAPSPAPVVGPTIAELWTRYLRTLGNERWVYNVKSMMTGTLAHFAPSVIEPRPRRGRFPVRRAVAGPDMLVSSLRPFHWTDWRDWMIANLDVGVTYRNLILARWMAFLNWAANDKRIEANPIIDVKSEPPKPRRETTMTEIDLQRMLDTNDSPVFRAHLLVAFDTGMRTDEARRLTWDQIDMITGRVKLSWTVTKTTRSRFARLLPRDLAALREVPRYDHTRFVFARATRDAPYSQARFWSWFREAAAKVGVQCAPGDGRIHFHDATRHSFATHALRSGVRLNQLQKLMGQSSMSTTELYAHTTDDDLEEAHRLLREAQRKAPHPVGPPADPDDP